MLQDVLIKIESPLSVILSNPVTIKDLINQNLSDEKALIELSKLEPLLKVEDVVKDVIKNDSTINIDRAIDKVKERFQSFLEGDIMAKNSILLKIIDEQSSFLEAIYVIYKNYTVYFGQILNYIDPAIWIDNEFINWVLNFFREHNHEYTTTKDLADAAVEQNPYKKPTTENEEWIKKQSFNWMEPSDLKVFLQEKKAVSIAKNFDSGKTDIKPYLYMVILNYKRKYDRIIIDKPDLVFFEEARRYLPLDFDDHIKFELLLAFLYVEAKKEGLDASHINLSEIDLDYISVNNILTFSQFEDITSLILTHNRLPFYFAAYKRQYNIFANTNTKKNLVYISIITHYFEMLYGVNTGKLIGPDGGLELHYNILDQETIRNRLRDLNEIFETFYGNELEALLKLLANMELDEDDLDSELGKNFKKYQMLRNNADCSNRELHDCIFKIWRILNEIKNPDKRNDEAEDPFYTDREIEEILDDDTVDFNDIPSEAPNYYGQYKNLLNILKTKLNIYKKLIKVFSLFIDPCTILHDHTNGNLTQIKNYTTTSCCHKI